MRERGQTAYDYLLGIVLLLVTIITVLSLFPQFFGPFVDPVSTDREKTSDRVAAEVIEMNSTMDTERTLDIEGLDQTIESDEETYLQTIRERAAVDEFRNVNIVIQSGQGSETTLSIGDQQPAGEPTATTVRNIRGVAHEDCRDGCKLIVRVW